MMPRTEMLRNPKWVRMERMSDVSSRASPDFSYKELDL